MSDRNVYVEWYVSEFGRQPIDSGYESDITWKAWQAAKADTPPAVVPELSALDAPNYYCQYEAYAWANGYDACRAAIAAAQSKEQPQ